MHTILSKPSNWLPDHMKETWKAFEEHLVYQKQVALSKQIIQYQYAIYKPRFMEQLFVSKKGTSTRLAKRSTKQKYFFLSLSSGRLYIQVFEKQNKQHDSFSAS